MSLIKQLIQQMANDPNLEIYSKMCKVLEVDETKRTCRAEPLDETAEIFGVRLQADPDKTTGLVMIPAINSNVIVTFINKNAAFVSLFTIIDKTLLNCEEIIINNGDNNGLIIIAELIAKLNQVEGDLNDLKQIFSAWTPVATDGGAALKTALAPYFAAVIPETQQADLENTKVKH